ncbi:MAG: nitrous oxide reductase accessory protein NosL [Nitrospirae bacterium]|nr:nitrous oxide reductase accessory protein NosL [Nitrospirota bacterium]
MKIFLIFGVMVILFALTTPGAADATDHTTACKQCGMDRTAFAQSRMLIVYVDGTSVGLCSINCAAAELKQNKDRRVKSLLVADYTTQLQIDAKTATWVVGGTKQGIMTSVAKWAFAGEKDALKFIQENGGKIISFDQAMKAAEEELGKSEEMTHKQHSHMGHMDMGPGSQMLFNPGFGEDIYHTHPAGMWMVNYKFMHMNMSGLREGTNNVSVNAVIPMMGTKYGYMMAPTKMTMDMHMFMVMYGITDRLTLMGMANYQENKMEMLMNMGKGNTQEPPMRTSGLGDTDLRGIYKINKYLVGSLGLSLPTGDIEKEFVTMKRRYRIPYGMQLGSGTYDLKPAITYTDFSDDAKWNWGTQLQYTWHTAKNENDWSYGDSSRVTGWLQRAFGPATSWLRLAYNSTGRVRGQDPEIRKLLDPNPMKGASSPDADPDNYGGQRLDGMLGLSFQKGAFSVGVEGGVPLYQDLNGLQLKTTWFLNVGMQVMF